MAIERFELELVSFKDITDTVRHLVFKKNWWETIKLYCRTIYHFHIWWRRWQVKRRSYSLGSLPTDNELLEIAITYVKGGIASEAFFNMQVGDITPAMGPAGRLILKDEDVKKLFLLELVPVLSLINQCFQNF